MAQDPSTRLPAHSPTQAWPPSGVDTGSPTWLTDPAGEADWLPPSSQIVIPAWARRPADGGLAPAPTTSLVRSRLALLLAVAALIVLILATLATLALTVPGHPFTGH